MNPISPELLAILNSNETRKTKIFLIKALYPYWSFETIEAIVPEESLGDY